ncbi:MAG: hypothetical protein E7122_05365 [Bacteroidales bacterium]|nr:hypothetical protein [Bacteroidales bacterium]
MQRIFIILVAVVVSLFAALPCSAQFNTGFINTAPPGANTMDQNNTNNEDDEVVVTSRKPAFTVKRYFKSLAHKDSMKVNQMAIGSMVLPGTAQIYNRQYWKLPVVYGAIGGCVGGAIANKGKDSQKYFIAGAVACYWGSVLDGVISYKSKEKPLPARASMLSALVPGLGQAYNGDYWKIPIFYTGLGACFYALGFNQQQYDRYRDMYIAYNDGEYKGNLTVDNIKWYRDQHRRMRDYSIIATILVYALNIIDANVFAHFSTFDISDDITFNVEPSMITPVAPLGSTFASNSMRQPFGFQMNLNF